MKNLKYESQENQYLLFSILMQIFRLLRAVDFPSHSQKTHKQTERSFLEISIDIDNYNSTEKRFIHRKYIFKENLKKFI